MEIILTVICRAVSGQSGAVDRCSVSLTYHNMLSEIDYPEFSSPLYMAISEDSENCSDFTTQTELMMERTITGCVITARLSELIFQHNRKHKICKTAAGNHSYCIWTF